MARRWAGWRSDQSTQDGQAFQSWHHGHGLQLPRKTAEIAAGAVIDGIYVVPTSLPVDLQVTRHGGAALRCIKTVDLQVRPVYHWLAGRVRAHVLLCRLDYYLEWHMRQSLAPMLFEDTDKQAAEALRASVVAPAPRSLAAVQKQTTKLTPDGPSSQGRARVGKAALTAGYEHPASRLDELLPWNWAVAAPRLPLLTDQSTTAALGIHLALPRPQILESGLEQTIMSTMSVVSTDITYRPIQTVEAVLKDVLDLLIDDQTTDLARVSTVVDEREVKPALWRLELWENIQP